MVHLDSCVEVEAAYYSAPPGWISRRVQVHWDDHHSRPLNQHTGELLREHLRHARGGLPLRTKTVPSRHRSPPNNCSAAPKLLARTLAASTGLRGLRSGEGACSPRLANSSSLRKNPFLALTNRCKSLILRSAMATFRGPEPFFRKLLERGHVAKRFNGQL
jgi:hypothetical protein